MSIPGLGQIAPAVRDPFSKAASPLKTHHSRLISCPNEYCLAFPGSPDINSSRRRAGRDTFATAVLGVPVRGPARLRTDDKAGIRNRGEGRY
jgi:hypothetical protein